MQRFHFRLEQVREWRALQLALEEARLERLLGERARIDAALQRLETDRAEARRAVLASPAVDIQQLAALEEHGRYLAREKQRLLDARAGCEQRIAAQRQRVMAADRDLRLLEKLKQRRLTEWCAASDAELEALAGELFLAHWHRSRR